MAGSRAACHRHRHDGEGTAAVLDEMTSGDRAGTVLVIGLGDLGSRVVDALARSPLDRLVAAARATSRTR
jgi:tRNA A37 threonylcarbamoyladenosine dehydratase